jgi:hypothetical protein
MTKVRTGGRWGAGVTGHGVRPTTGAVDPQDCGVTSPVTFFYWRRATTSCPCSPGVRRVELT